MFTRDELKVLALELPREQRARLACELLESLDDPLEDPADVESAWLTEAQHRMRKIADGSAELVDWETVRDEALARIRRR